MYFSPNDINLSHSCFLLCSFNWVLKLCCESFRKKYSLVISDAMPYLTLSS